MPPPHSLLRPSLPPIPNLKLQPHKLPNLPEQPQPPECIPPHGPRHLLARPQQQPHTAGAVNVARRLGGHGYVAPAGVGPDVHEDVVDGNLEGGIGGLEG